MTAAIHVCQTCAVRDLAHGQPDFGQALAARLVQAEGLAGFSVRASGCLGTCAPDANVGLTATGRWGWLFRGLRVETDLADFLSFLHVWQAAPQGLPSKCDRPPRLRTRIVGRLPPNNIEGSTP